jgi:hypothetical protein
MEKNNENDNFRILLAAVLIFVGTIWMLSELGQIFHFQYLFENILLPVKKVFHGVTRAVFSWQMIIIIIGIILLSSKKHIGLVFLVIGVIFMVPRIFQWESFTYWLFFPMLIIGIGITMMVKSK